MSVKSIPEAEPRQRLDTWKLIAQYMDRSCRTVQRWHRVYGMPIHHVAGASSSIYGYREELDRWLLHRNSGEEGYSAENKLFLLNAIDGTSGEEGRQAASYGSSFVSHADKSHSAELVTLAKQLRLTLSDTNVGTIARIFREAADLDPFNAEAFAGLAHILITEALWGKVHGAGGLSAAWAALRRSQDLEPGLPEGRCAFAWLKMLSERDWSGAAEAFDDLLRSNQQSARVVMGRALLHIAEGQPASAVELFEANADLDVLCTPRTVAKLWSKYLSGEHERVLNEISQARSAGSSGVILDVVEAMASVQCEGLRQSIRRIEDLVADSGHNCVLRGTLGLAYALQGDLDKARDILQFLLKPGTAAGACDPYSLVLVHVGLGDPESAVECLERCYREGSLWSLGIPCDPVLAGIASITSFQRFMSGPRYPAAAPAGSWISAC